MILRLSLVSFALIGFACGDTVYLRNGASVQGNYAGGDTRSIKMVVGDHVETYPVDQIVRLEFGNETASAIPAQPAPPPPVAEPPAPAYQEQGLNTQRPQDTASDPGPLGIDVPSGTILTVRMIDSVDSERASLGQTFRASVDEPVVVNGQTVIPRGADVLAKLVDNKQAGTFTGSTTLSLALRSVIVNGRRVEVTTSDVTQTSGSKGKSTAVRTGGGAVVGAVLGGLIGGGRGAAVGATSGAGVGAGSEVVTKGARIKIPSETRLSFVLQQPVRL